MTPEDLGFNSKRLDLVGAVGRRLVDDGRLPGALVQVARRGEVVYSDRYGLADRERDQPVSQDTIFRIYSMTKPITAVAVMQLYEKGLVLLEDPIEMYIPAFADMQVWDGGTRERPVLRPATRSITVHDLLRHTSGLTYGFRQQHALDAIYRRVGLGNLNQPDLTLADMCEQLGKLPLLFDPGTQWHYSMSTDVLAHLVEIVAEQSFSSYLREFITDPLDMFETRFAVPEEHADRLAALYMDTPDGMVLADDPTTSAYLAEPSFESGGGGLVSTIDDYQRFASMLLAGGELRGNRVLGRRTIEFMTTNHLPGAIDMNEAGQTLFPTEAMAGRGFGLGFGVIVDPAKHAAVSSVGEFGWGGMASTSFWVDPTEEITVIFMTQLAPSNSYPIRRLLRSAVNQALL
ncbi:MAG: beta-lactamase family protein [Acidimicrobiales bacterium]|nr:beta-lactamase family protein [Acidimicrobiales bacterium]